MTPTPRRELAGLVDQGIVSAGSLLVTAIFLRGAGLEQFGILSLVWLVLLFATAIQHAAVVAPAYAMLPKLEAPEAARFRGWLVLVQLAFLALLLVILAGSWIAPWFSLVPRSAGLLAAILFLATRQLFSFCRLQLFVNEEGPRKALFIDTIHTVLSVGGLGYVAYTGALTAHSGLYVLAAASGLATLCAVPCFYSLGCEPCFPGRLLVKRHVQLSKWLVGKALAQWFTANSFLTALGTLQGAAALGGVRAAQTLIGVAGVVIQGFENIIPARAAGAYAKGGSAGLREFLRTSLWRWFGYLCLCLLPIVVFPDFFLWLLTGKKQAQLLEPLYFFAAGSLLALAILFLQVSLRTVERVGVLFWAQLAAGVVGALAAVPVTMAYGIRGCMVGILVQQLIVFLFLVRPTRRYLGKSSARP